MEVQVDDRGGMCTVRMKEMPLSVANGLRRACLSQVTVPAFEKLLVRVNTSDHPDELIAHRLGLFPLRGTGGDGVATLRLRCADRQRVVRLNDFEWPENLAPVNPESPLVTLTQGQMLDLSVTALWGSGSDHAKFCACSRAALKHHAEPNGYTLELDSRHQHPALVVAVMAAQQMIESILEMQEVAA